MTGQPVTVEADDLAWVLSVIPPSAVTVLSMPRRHRLTAALVESAAFADEEPSTGS